MWSDEIWTTQLQGFGATRFAHKVKTIVGQRFMSAIRSVIRNEVTRQALSGGRIPEKVLTGCPDGQD
ncbi:MAG: hypothetical protein KME21_29445 [Desmonostoc vinosum HA7617-LM4]|nr:hypothetical protein [Desmonostoc vinosum HA7617-LM4]